MQPLGHHSHSRTASNVDLIHEILTKKGRPSDDPVILMAGLEVTAGFDDELFAQKQQNRQFPQQHLLMPAEGNRE